MMLSNYQSIRNAMTMGMLTEKQSNNLIYMTTILADQSTLGGTIINMRKEVTAMVVRYMAEEETIQVYGLKALKDYLKA